MEGTYGIGYGSTRIGHRKRDESYDSLPAQLIDTPRLIFISLHHNSVMMTSVVPFNCLSLAILHGIDFGF